MHSRVGLVRRAGGTLCATTLLVAFVAAPIAVAAFVDPSAAQTSFTADTLQPPSNLTAGPCLLGSVTLSWTASPSTWADGYQIYWSTTSGGPYGSGPVTSVTSPKIVTGLSALQTYYFVVRAYDGNWRSPFSSQRSVFCTL